MARFSERIGAGAPRTILQLGGMDDELRNSIWNTILHAYAGARLGLVARLFAVDVMKTPLHEVPDIGFLDDNRSVRRWLWERFSKVDWYSVYDLVEILVSSERYPDVKSNLIRSLNKTLESNLSGYRFFAKGQLAPIADQSEIETITEAIGGTGGSGFSGAKKHLQTAVDHLSKRPHPDFRNSMKESISALESAVKQISGQKRMDLALRKCREKLGLHASLVGSWEKLYGYTSDEGGIRHALTSGGEGVGFDEAKYMLVTCSAIVNFLVAKENSSRP